MRVTVNTTGIHRVTEKLRSRAVTLKGLAAGIVLLQQAARSHAPRASGTLAAAQEYKIAPGSTGQTKSYAIQGTAVGENRIVHRPGRGRVVAKPGLYDLFVRLGTRPRGRHPGTRPNDYRQRAAQSRGDASVKRVLAAMADEVQRIILAARV